MGILQRLGCGIGYGLVSGFAGTAAITVSQMIEMRIRKRPPSTSPAKVAGKVLGFEPKDGKAESRLAQLAHFGYGTAWGLARPLLDAVGVRGLAGAALHWSGVQQTALWMLPATGVAPPAKEWGRKETGLEMLHHLVYAAAAGAVYDMSSARRSFPPFVPPRRTPYGMAWAAAFALLFTSVFLSESGPPPAKDEGGKEGSGKSEEASRQEETQRQERRKPSQAGKKSHAPG
jgi:hypothetical protein